MDLFEIHEALLHLFAQRVGRLGCCFIWWGIELDHRWHGEWRWFWEPLEALGVVLRAVPTWVGLPLPEIPEFPD